MAHPTASSGFPLLLLWLQSCFSQEKPLTLRAEEMFSMIVSFQLQQRRGSRLTHRRDICSMNLTGEAISYCIYGPLNRFLWMGTHTFTAKNLRVNMNKSSP